MGYAFLMGACGCCHRTFSCNPVKVPSFRFDGVTKEPICKTCIEIINKKRNESFGGGE